MRISEILTQDIFKFKITWIVVSILAVILLANYVYDYESPRNKCARKYEDLFNHLKGGAINKTEELLIDRVRESFIQECLINKEY